MDAPYTCAPRVRAWVSDAPVHMHTMRGYGWHAELKPCMETQNANPNPNPNPHSARALGKLRTPGLVVCACALCKAPPNKGRNTRRALALTYYEEGAKVYSDLYAFGSDARYAYSGKDT